MRKRTAINALIMVLFLAATGCASLETAGHKYVMRGQVLEVTDGSAYLCIGMEGGAKIGQEYTVYRFIKVQFARPRYDRQEIGKVRITEIDDQHYATGKILKGAVKEYDVVDLD